MTGIMRPQLQPPLTPFVDPLPLPRRILAGQGGGELTVRIRAAAHRIHRDLPESRVWAYEGLVPGPTVEAERGQPVRVCWRNEIDQPYPVVVTLAPAETNGDGVAVQCLPGLSGGTPDPDAAALTGYTVVHLHGAVTAAPSDGWTENIFAAEAADPGQLLPYPDVMRFRAVAGHPARRPRPGRLATDITAPTQADRSPARRRAR